MLYAAVSGRGAGDSLTAHCLAAHIKRSSKTVSPGSTMLVYYVMPAQLLVWGITNSEMSFTAVR